MSRRTLKRNFEALSFVLLCGTCFCTTAVVYVQPNVIVVGVDRLGQGYNPAGKLSAGAVDKVTLLRDRFAVACVGLERYYKDGPRGRRAVAIYDFKQWMRDLDSRITPETSVLALTTIIETESRRIFFETIPVDFLMRSGVIKHREDMDRYLVQYVVAGFDRGEPTVILVQYEFDWQHNHLIGPERDVQWPSRTFLSGMTFVGQQSAFGQALVPNTGPYMRLSALAPAAFNKLLARRMLPDNECVVLVRAFIAIQSAALPEEVGRGSNVVLLPSGGVGVASKYESNLGSPGVPRRHGD
jgi:hypothetical protein